MNRNSDSTGNDDGTRLNTVGESVPARTRDAYGRFLPGAAGGPGRPKLGDCLSDALRKYGEMPLSELATLAKLACHPCGFMTYATARQACSWQRVSRSRWYRKCSGMLT